jgi:hypothetical protein
MVPINNVSMIGVLAWAIYFRNQSEMMTLLARWVRLTTKPSIYMWQVGLRHVEDPYVGEIFPMPWLQMG